jgi:peroxiredoxin
MLAAGARAPEFDLDTAAGGAEALAGARARGPALVAFFKVSCPVCQMTFPFLERLHRQADGKLQVLGVSQDSAADTRDFNREYGVSFPVLIDRRGYPVSNAFGIESVPSLFLIEPDGAISLAGAGFSKRDLEAVGRRVGATPFRAGDQVPEFRPG